MLEQLAIIDDLHDEAAAGGGAAAIERMRSRDKMPVRERIQMVLDTCLLYTSPSPRDRG